ncbi:sensor histidine kinase [Croceimicrobium sp.]|uniref:sensor histidine kinase n=1 Tax=Croceimicrobium sp. TaxID=2828340 RepID=UPI003BAA4C79
MKRIFLINLLILLSWTVKAQLSVATFSDGKSHLESEIIGLDYVTEKKGVANFDNGSVAYVKLVVDAEYASQDRRIFLSYALIDTIRFYRRDADGLHLILETGQAYDFDTRAYESSDFVFPVKGGVQEYYFEIYSHKPVVLPFQLVERESLSATLSNNDFFFGTYVGLIAVMFLYNLVIFFLTRDRSYLFYILYLLTLGLAQAALFGYTDRFLFQEFPAFNRIFAVLSGALVAIASIFFINNFLRLKTKAPFFRKLLFSVVPLDVVAIILLLMGYESFSYKMVNMVSLVGSIIAIVAAVKLAQSGFKPANFFLLAWSVFLTSVVIFALKDFDIIPYNPVFRRSMLFGSSVEVVLLSVALADRINQLRREKEYSQARALEMARENERIIKEQNIELEKRVEARTMELQEANEELQVTLDNLKETQTQLVDAEKMASLGQLTAGIAHEINNPINFITSNIKPLKLDLDEVYTIVDRFSQLPEDCSPDQLKQAKSSLQEFDYDFLKEEIESLVSGISDGAVRTSEIVLGLRNFSRLDEDVVKKANLNEGLDSTMILLRNKTKDLIEVVRDYDENLMDIDCFPGKLNQAFMNILNNGIYAVNAKRYEEGEEPTLTLKTRMVDSEMVAVHLIDNGIGMSEETKKKLYEPFFTTKEVGEGTGLGMSIVFKIIDKHGGRIEVNSELGKGTEFILFLPIRQPNEFA